MLSVYNLHNEYISLSCYFWLLFRIEIITR
nr:MAG TPA: hypothetical protein [Bacteriophage sp.]DAU98940.1 MAG TPA: hypothetical protein [Bacteriophage sp.]